MFVYEYVCLFAYEYPFAYEYLPNPVIFREYFIIFPYAVGTMYRTENEQVGNGNFGKVMLQMSKRCFN